MTVVISARDVVVSESDGYADVVVSLSAPSARAVTVGHRNENSTALFNADFGGVSGTLTFGRA